MAIQSRIKYVKEHLECLSTIPSKGTKASLGLGARVGVYSPSSQNFSPKLQGLSSRVNQLLSYLSDEFIDDDKRSQLVGLKTSIPLVKEGIQLLKKTAKEKDIREIEKLSSAIERLETFLNKKFSCGFYTQKGGAPEEAQGVELSAIKPSTPPSPTSPLSEGFHEFELSLTKHSGIKLPLKLGSRDVEMELRPSEDVDKEWGAIAGPGSLNAKKIVDAFQIPENPHLVQTHSIILQNRSGHYFLAEKSKANITRIKRIIGKERLNGQKEYVIAGFVRDSIDSPNLEDFIASQLRHQSGLSEKSVASIGYQVALAFQSLRKSGYHIERLEPGSLLISGNKETPHVRILPPRKKEEDKKSDSWELGLLLFSMMSSSSSYFSQSVESNRRFLQEKMPKNPDKTDRIRYLNYFFLRPLAFRESSNNILPRLTSALLNPNKDARLSIEEAIGWLKRSLNACSAEKEILEAELAAGSPQFAGLLQNLEFLQSFSSQDPSNPGSVRGYYEEEVKEDPLGKEFSVKALKEESSHLGILRSFGGAAHSRLAYQKVTDQIEAFKALFSSRGKYLTKQETGQLLKIRSLITDAKKGVEYFKVPYGEEGCNELNNLELALNSLGTFIDGCKALSEED